MKGLNQTIHTLVKTGAPTIYAEVVEKAKNIEASLLWGGSQQVSSFTSQGSGSSIQMPVGIPPYQPPHSNQPQKQQKFKAKGNQFKKKSSSSSSSSGSSRGGRYSGYVRDSCRSCGVSDISVVKDFPDVFTDEIHGFPPQREIDFSIKLMSGTNPISRAPCRLAVAELKEIKEKLRDLLEKGYIRPKFESSFQTLKENLTIAPVLALPSGSDGFVVCKDAYLNRLGCVLMQNGRVKAERMRPGGMLHSLEVPKWNWEHIAMDFVTYLSRSNRGCDAIWSSLQSALGSKMTMSTTYHPQTDDVGERQMSKPEFIQEMEDKVIMIRKRMKAAQDRLESYANKRRRPLEFRVRDYVFSKVSLFCSTMRFGRKGKFAPRYIGPYGIVERIDTLAYRLDFPQSLSAIHDVFHVSMLRKYEPDTSHVLSTDDVALDSSLSYVEHPVQILDRKKKQLKNKMIPLVLVYWSRHGIEEATLDLEARMHQEWPHLFENMMNNSIYSYFSM
ncbi:uncharacterized protein LOC142550098 [Primulina tabacum]|uniref:uncharacterized protein LOC142550098 n=1 Tax=Primulina tabacum TaxID=48773 RepID=UPI003F5A2A18